MIDLDDLEDLCPGLPAQSAGPLAFRAAVALQRHHEPGVELIATVRDQPLREEVRWTKRPARSAATEDFDSVTEEGAEALALALAFRQCGWRVKRRLQARLAEPHDQPNPRPDPEGAHAAENDTWSDTPPGIGARIGTHGGCGGARIPGGLRGGRRRSGLRSSAYFEGGAGRSIVTDTLEIEAGRVSPRCPRAPRSTFPASPLLRIPLCAEPDLISVTF